VKKFSCDCINAQIKNPDQVYIGFYEKSLASILCAYKPNEKVTLRNIKLQVNYCPYCGSKLKDV